MLAGSLRATVLLNILPFTVGAVLVVANPARGDLIVVNNLDSPVVIDFNESQYTQLQDVAGPVQVGSPVGEDVTVEVDTASGLWLYSTGWGLQANGDWRTGFFVGANDARPGSIVFRFNSSPVSGVGAYMNYCPNCIGAEDVIISAFDSGGILLESYNLSVVAPIVASMQGASGASNDRTRTSARSRSGASSRLQMTLHSPGLRNQVQVGLWPSVWLSR